MSEDTFKHIRLTPAAHAMLTELANREGRSMAKQIEYVLGLYTSAYVVKNIDTLAGPADANRPLVVSVEEK